MRDEGARPQAMEVRRDEVARANPRSGLQFVPHARARMADPRSADLAMMGFVVLVWRAA